MENGKYFEDLLALTCVEFRKIHPEVSEKIQDWKGEDIDLFRNELYEKVGSSISEKWFYTHVKNRQDRLPRIDAINVLAQYNGFKGWKHYVNERASRKQELQTGKKTRKPLKLVVLTFLVLIFSFLLYQFNAKPNAYRFCFVNKTTGLPIEDSRIQLQLILENESPKTINLTNNCYQGEGNYVAFTVEGNYYKPQTIKRNILEDNYQEEVMLVSDDYARVINLFSNSNVEDWRMRRKQLSEMMHVNVQIYHISKEGVTLEMYNRDEFIDQLTIPTRGLKSVEILETEYLEGKIVTMKFTRS